MRRRKASASNVSGGSSRPGPGNVERRFARRFRGLRAAFLDRRNLGQQFRGRLVAGRAQVIQGGQLLAHFVIHVELFVLAVRKRQVVLEPGVRDGDLRLGNHESGRRWRRRRLRLGGLRRLGRNLLGRRNGRQWLDQRLERRRLLEGRRLEGVEERLLLGLGGDGLGRHGNEAAHEQQQQQQVEPGRGGGDGGAPPDGDAGQVINGSAPAQAGEQPAGARGTGGGPPGPRPRRSGARTAEGGRSGGPPDGLSFAGGGGPGAFFGVVQPEPRKVGTHRSAAPASTRNSSVA